uniref:SNF2 N-terminal domain-containing protein n=1 Tax=Panagrolaimus davidi TaxID=227884 RepID=A0A914R2C7_9BILA
MSQEEIKIAFSQFAKSLPPEEQAQLATMIMPSSQQLPNCGSILDQLSNAIKEYLKEHQKEAIEFLYKRIIEPPNGFYNKDGGKGAIIAHNMGLGKTTTTVAFIYGIFNEPAIKKLNFKILIVSPVNVIQHWIDEFEKPIWDGFFKDKVCKLDAPICSNKNDPHDIRRMQLGDWQRGEKDKSILIVSLFCI